MGVPTSDADFGFEPRIGRSVSIDHAAIVLKVSRRTVYNRIREGRLKTIRTLGASQRVLVDSLQVFVLSEGLEDPHRAEFSSLGSQGATTSW